MSNKATVAWGTQSLGLKLPAVTIRIFGLSHAQQDTLSERYSGFMAPTATVADVTCHAYRLRKSPEVGTDELTFDGQYAPKKVHNKSAATLSVTGINFEADFVLDSSGKSTLGVVNEEELTYPNVIENYFRIISAYKVLKHRGVVLHSAGLVFNEEAFIFCGRSNAGKTTLTRKAYADGARVLSDDINLVLPGKSGYDAYAVPFTGEFGRALDHEGGKEHYPLTGIVLLQQSNHLQTLPVDDSLAVARLLSGSPFVNTDEHESEALFDSVAALVAKVPVIHLLNRRSDHIHDIMTAVKKQFAEL